MKSGTVGESSPAAADELILELVERALALEDSSQRYQVVSWLEPTGIRRVTVRTWAILYRILPSHVEVMRIVHGGMRLETLFR